MLKRTANFSFLLFGFFTLLVMATSAFLPESKENAFDFPIRKKKFYETKQKKFDVQKDFYLPQENKRIHHTLQASDSIVTIKSLLNQIDLVEDMNEVQYFRTLLDAKQELATFQQLKAKTGKYFYSTSIFEGQDVTMQWFEEELSSKQQHPAMRGSAENISIHLSPDCQFFEASDLSFSANNLNIFR